MTAVGGLAAGPPKVPLSRGYSTGGPNFDVVAPVPFSTVCFRARGSDEANARLLERINDSGKAFLSHTELHGDYTLRFAVGNVRTREDNLRSA